MPAASDPDCRMIMKDKEKNREFHIRISSNPPLLDLKLDQVWKYRDFIVIYTRTHFAKRYKQTILGPIWLFVNPLLQSLIHSFIFGVVAGIDTEAVPVLLFYLASNGIWNFFASVFARCSKTFSDNTYLFGKVYFPRLTIPIAYVCISAIEFLIQLFPFTFFSLYYLVKFQYAVNFRGLLFAPVCLLWLGCIGLGLGVIVSAATSKYRDLRILVDMALGLWMYATPIVYPISRLDPGILRSLIRLNPLTPVIELYRKAVFGVGDADPLSIGLSLLLMIAALAVGLIRFNKTEKNFMDTV